MFITGSGDCCSHRTSIVHEGENWISDQTQRPVHCQNILQTLSDTSYFSDISSDQSENTFGLEQAF